MNTENKIQDIEKQLQIKNNFKIVKRKLIFSFNILFVSLFVCNYMNFIADKYKDYSFVNNNNICSLVYKNYFQYSSSFKYRAEYAYTYINLTEVNSTKVNLTNIEDFNYVKISKYYDDLLKFKKEYYSDKINTINCTVIENKFYIEDGNMYLLDLWNTFLLLCFIISYTAFGTSIIVTFTNMFTLFVLYYKQRSF